jgi:hypothetical protein
MTPKKSSHLPHQRQKRQKLGSRSKFSRVFKLLWPSRFGFRNKGDWENGDSRWIKNHELLDTAGGRDVVEG